MTRRHAHLSIANLHESVSRISTDTTVAPGQKTAEVEFAYRM